MQDYEEDFDVSINKCFLMEKKDEQLTFWVSPSSHVKVSLLFFSATAAGRKVSSLPVFNSTSSDKIPWTLRMVCWHM